MRHHDDHTFTCIFTDGQLSRHIPSPGPTMLVRARPYGHA